MLLGRLSGYLASGSVAGLAHVVDRMDPDITLDPAVLAFLAVLAFVGLSAASTSDSGRVTLEELRTMAGEIRSVLAREEKTGTHPPGGPWMAHFFLRLVNRAVAGDRIYAHEFAGLAEEGRLAAEWRIEREGYDRLADRRNAWNSLVERWQAQLSEEDGVGIPLSPDFRNEHGLVTLAELQEMLDQSLRVRDVALAEPNRPPGVGTVNREGMRLLSLAIRDRTHLYADEIHDFLDDLIQLGQWRVQQTEADEFAEMRAGAVILFRRLAKELPSWATFPDLTVGERIQAGRARLQMTQEMLAAKLGVDRSAVARWERNARTPRREHRRLLAQLFGGHVADYEASS